MRERSFAAINGLARAFGCVRVAFVDIIEVVEADTSRSKAMSFELEAVYENGMLKLDRPLPLVEHQRVKVVVDEGANAQLSTDKDWWKVLQEIWADQERRGYVGTVTEFDRGDEAYEKRMREIWSNTVHGQKGDADLP